MSENLFGLTVAADKGLDDLQCQRLLSENRRYQEVMLQYRCALKALESRLESSVSVTRSLYSDLTIFCLNLLTHLTITTVAGRAGGFALSVMDKSAERQKTTPQLKKHDRHAILL